MIQSNRRMSDREVDAFLRNRGPCATALATLPTCIAEVGLYYVAGAVAMRASTLRHLDARQPCRAASGRKMYVGTNQQSRERATRRGRRAQEDRASSRCLPHDSCMASAYRAHAGTPRALTRSDDLQREP